MIEQDPRATGMLNYCESINIRGIEECRVRFLMGLWHIAKDNATPTPQRILRRFHADSSRMQYRYTIADCREAAAAAEKGFEERTKWAADIAAIGAPLIGANWGRRDYCFNEGGDKTSKKFLDNQDLELLKKDHGDNKATDRGDEEQDNSVADKPDQPDEDESSTTMLDGTERSLERCVEKEERRLWRQISITTIDQDSPTEDKRKEEAAKQLELSFCDKSFYDIEYCRQWEFECSLETPFPPDLSEDGRRRAEAESNLRVGICDLLFYGEEYCRGWKLGLDERETEYAPEDVQTVNTFSPFCLENVVTRESCENMRLEFHENFMTSDSLEAAVNTLFTPSPPIEGQLPNIDQLLVSLQVNSERRTGTEPG